MIGDFHYTFMVEWTTVQNSIKILFYPCYFKIRTRIT